MSGGGDEDKKPNTGDQGAHINLKVKGQMSGGGGDEDTKADTGDQGAPITLKVRDQDGNEVFFRMKRSTQLKKLMYVYCYRKSVDLIAFAFLFNGRRLRGEQTPDELKMEEGDEIDAMRSMGGPCGVCSAHFS